MVIEKAEPADLARAFIREAFTSGDDPEWWRSNNPNGAAAKHDAHTALGIPPTATDPPGRSRQHQARSPPGGRACSLPYPPATRSGVAASDTPVTIT